MSNHKALRKYCAEEKRKAQELCESGDPTTMYNAQQAVTAWDELQGAFRKPKPITPKKLEKVKDTALRIVSLMWGSQYRDQTLQKIENLTLKTTKETNGKSS